MSGFGSKSNASCEGEHFRPPQKRRRRRKLDIWRDEGMVGPLCVLALVANEHGRWAKEYNMKNKDGQQFKGLLDDIYAKLGPRWPTGWERNGLFLFGFALVESYRILRDGRSCEDEFAVNLDGLGHCMNRLLRRGRDRRVTNIGYCSCCPYHVAFFDHAIRLPEKCEKWLRWNFRILSWRKSRASHLRWKALT